MDLSWLRRTQNRATKKASLLRWLPVLGAILLLAVVVIVAIQTRATLKEAIALRKQTVEVILAAHAFEGNLLELQRGLRSYVSVGDVNALASFEQARKQEPQQFAQLVRLTRDNPVQQERLRELGPAMQKVFSYSDRMIDVYRHQGSRAAAGADVGSTNRTAFSTANDLLKGFLSYEQQLLDVRDAAEQSDYRDAEHFLVGGSLLAVLLLLFASFTASRQLAFRYRAEIHLSRALMLQRAILNSADYAILTTGPDGIVQTFNPAAERLLGYAATEVIGRETPVLWHDPQEIAERAQSLSVKLGMPVRASFDAIAKKVQFEQIEDGEWTFIRKDHSRFIASLVITALADQTGNFTGYLGIFRDISLRKSLEGEREKLILELKNALAEVKTLSGLIPICGWCKSVRNDSGYWQSVEQYVHAHTEATFTHGICPTCKEKFKDDAARVKKERQEKSR
jgi:PAS domain S-box-containing protein